MAADSPAEKPNIILLMTDQQRWDALGVENPSVKTPNLDRLARSGVRFRQAVCQTPICVPSRAAMMFGLYASQSGIRTNTDVVCDCCLPSTPLPEVLRQGGYQTAGFGKTHWSDTKCTPTISTRGFEIRSIPHARGGAYEEVGAVMISDANPNQTKFYREETKDYGRGEEGVKGYIGATSKVPKEQHVDGWTQQECLKFLDSGVDSSRPLFLYLSFLKPHAGLNPPKEFEDLYDVSKIPDVVQPPWKQEMNTHLVVFDQESPFLGHRPAEWRKAFESMPTLERRRTTLRYWANCSWLDSYLGEVLGRLDKMGRLKNALIIYVSDHGDLMGERNFRFSKYCLFDSSVRVPLIVSGSAVPEALRGKVDERPAEMIDILPTIRAAAGITSGTLLPGLDLLTSETRSGSFSEFHGSGFEKEAPAPAYMWRNKDWKLIITEKGLRAGATKNPPVVGELYDLKNDPHEWTNLYNDDKYAQVREKMKTELLAHLAGAWAMNPR